ncbi:MAG TPA: hypothetical protein VKK61_10030, partial [Tepidisphaeraceae bacterium]|nr:hypothetical protein [Tepidisphaeraceae bacterium]
MSEFRAAGDFTGQNRTSRRSRSRIARSVGCVAEPLEDRLLMALARQSGKSGVSANLSTNPTVKQQQLLVDPPDAPIAGSISVSYDPTVSHLIEFEPGPGYDNEGIGGFVEVLAPATTEFEDFTFNNTDWTITTTTTDTGSNV